MDRHRSDIPLLDRIKIQAEILVHILHTLQDEVGRERAHELLRSAVADMYRGMMHGMVSAQGTETVQDGIWGLMNREGWEGRHPIKVNERHVSDERADFDVTDCQYAAFFNEIGEPDLGFLLVCCGDFDMLEDLPEIELTRTQTRMQGATHCDFRYRRSGSAPKRPT